MSLPAEVEVDEHQSAQPARPVRLTRRMVALLVCGALLAGLLVLAAVLPVPYVTLQPGPTENTLGAYDGVDVIVIEDRETFPTEGNLDLTTVSVTSADSNINLFQAIRDWLDPQRAVVPRENVYQPNESPDDIRARNAEQMQTSQDNAIAAALQELDIPIAERVFVGSIVEGAPALDRLRAGDLILAVDGESAANVDAVRSAIEAHAPGDTVTFTVERDDEEVEIAVPTIDSPADPGRTVVGIEPQMAFDFPFDVTITLGEDIGGPSAGLMFSLGIVDKLTPGPLTGGIYVAGTGMINPAGEVGPIGGIQQKIAGARDAGATVFLVPADNCPAAAAAAIDGVQLVRVETLAGAIDALEAISAGTPDDAPGCS